MNNERYTTFNFAKLFLLMIIPIYGFCFTFLLSFSKDVDQELKCLARGALIARLVFLLILAGGIIVFSFYLLPLITDFLNKANMLRLFL